MFKPDYSSEGPESSNYNLIRSGTVIDRRAGPNGAEVRVAYPDRGVTSDWLPVGQPLTGGAMSHSCPRINSNVIVGHLPTGIEQGVILCSTATDNGGGLIPDHLDSVVTVFEDGAAIGYNPQSGILNVVGVNQINIGAGGTVSVYSGGSLLLQVGGDVTGSVGGNLSATVSGTTQLTSGGDTTITAPNIALKGNTKITGTLEVTQNVTFDAGGTIQSHLQNLDGAGGGS